ncbi:MAG: AMP-binding protein [Clostridia bacterium]|nr:AMP-binding protein [Clostridia bacterium]
MKLNNIAGFKTIDQFVNYKIQLYTNSDKSLRSLFELMFSEKENVMAERSDGYKIIKTTYGECYAQTLKVISATAKLLNGAEQNEIIGLYLNNSLEWIKIFWSIIACGYRPLLLNSRASDATINGILNEYSVKKVICDGKNFNAQIISASDLINLANDCTSADISALTFGNEIIFMSTGTTENIKLCAYTGENLYYQICDSANIIKSCTQIKEHYKGQLKLLTLLPFYHVFGFIAVYAWFGFFSRTFVFLKDLNPQTLLNTVRKHEVTHVFAVPLVWETIYKEAVRKIKARGEATFNKFNKGMAIASSGKLGAKLTHTAFREIRDNIFGESIKFLISGGSVIKPKVLKFFNGIGYHMANGYGMTEIGITSVEVSSVPKILNSGSIGSPFKYTEYKISENGELLVRGKTMAHKILQKGKAEITDYDRWFNTRDLMRNVNGRYFIDGRADDLIVCKNGENLNPVIAERQINVVGADSICIFANAKKNPVLLISAKGCYTPEKLKEIQQNAFNALKAVNLECAITDIAVTCDPLLLPTDFKVSRKSIAKRYEQGSFNLLKEREKDLTFDRILTALENKVVQIIANCTRKEANTVAVNANFFTDLGGTSLDYFTFVNEIKNHFDVQLPMTDGTALLTAEEVCLFIKECKN